MGANVAVPHVIRPGASLHTGFLPFPEMNACPSIIVGIFKIIYIFSHVMHASCMSHQLLLIILGMFVSTKKNGVLLVQLTIAPDLFFPPEIIALLVMMICLQKCDSFAAFYHDLHIIIPTLMY